MTTPPTTQPVPLGSTSPQWRLVWNDEFDGPAGAPPDLQKWQPAIGGQGWGNQEWEYYTGHAENAALDGNGALVITARAVPDPASSGLDCWYGPCRYTSARLLTRERFEFTYGWVEARIRLPGGQGVWPAFWILGGNYSAVGWPECGEIDVMENIGREPGRIHGTVHGPGYYRDDGLSGPFDLPAGQAFKDDFHVFALEWEPGALRWYVDGQRYFAVTPAQLPAGARWVFDHPFFLLLNVAVGGLWPGYPDETTVFPQAMLVDYVRVYQR